jgi:hypothetical protein
MAQTYRTCIQSTNSFEGINSFKRFKMPESTINQRLKILIDALGMKVRTFSTALEISEATTRNYLDRGSKPGADYLQKILERFERANITWLLTGIGEPLLPKSGEASEPRSISQKNISGGQTIGVVHGTATQNQYTMAECEKDLASARKEIALLTSQLADKERTIQILLDKSGK